MKNKLHYLLIIIAIVALVILFYFLKPKNTSIDEQVTEKVTVGQASPSAITNVIKTFELKVIGRKLISGPEIIKVVEGNKVSIKITLDEDDEFHLHGYDTSVELQKDIPAELNFTANLTGIFIYELENAKVDIGALEVSPK